MALGYSSDRELIQCDILHSLGTIDISTGLFGKIRRLEMVRGIINKLPINREKRGMGKMMKENEIQRVRRQQKGRELHIEP